MRHGMHRSSKRRNHGDLHRRFYAEAYPCPLIHRRPAQTPLPSPAEAHLIPARQCYLDNRPNKTSRDLDATALDALTQFIRTP